MRRSPSIVFVLALTTAACASSTAPVRHEQVTLPLPAAPTASTSSQASTSTPAPASDKSDRDLFDAAQLALVNGEKERARATFVELIQKWPSSTYVPFAHVALGDLSFEAADAAHMKEAEDEYHEAVKFPPPTNHVYGYAWYRLAWVYWNRGDGAQALAALKKTIDFSTQYPQEPDVAKLRREALRDTIPIFAQVGNPSRAYPFFRAMSGDDARAIAMLEDLARAYSTSGKLAEAQNVYRELAARDTPHACMHGVRARFSVPGATRAAVDAELKKCP